MIALLIVVATIATSQQAPTNKQRYEQFLEQHNQRLIDKTKENLAEAEKLLDALKKRKTHGRAGRLAVQQEKKTVRDKIKVYKSDLKDLHRQKENKRYTWPKPVLRFGGSDLYVGLIGPLWEKSPILFTGMSTTGIVQDQILDIAEDYFEITGTYTYPTALGNTNTVSVLEPFDMTGITP